jgi:hypothetical protein
LFGVLDFGQVNWAIIFITIAVMTIATAILLYRARKSCVMTESGTQTDIIVIPDLVFTPHGQCYHLANCETINNWRRGATQLTRRACAYCLGSVLVEPDPERG